MDIIEIKDGILSMNHSTNTILTIFIKLSLVQYLSYYMCLAYANLLEIWKFWI